MKKNTIKKKKLEKSSPMTRSEIMATVKSKDTTSEILLRKELWKRNLRYRKNLRSVLGTPDIVYLRQKVAIFCDSEFWHGKLYLQGKKIPKNNRELWIEKFKRNIERDKFVNKSLLDEGWKVIRFWESEIKSNLIECANIIEEALREDEVNI